MSNTSVEVVHIIDRANAFFRESKDDMIAERWALQLFVFTLLYESGNYHGYNYLTKEPIKDLSRVIFIKPTI